MKKLLFQTVFAVLLTSSAIANPDASVNQRVKKSFEKEFVGAESVSWEAFKSKNIYHASFIFNNERFNAYFDEEGMLLATGRYIKSENLPLVVGKTIANRFQKSTVNEVIEYITDNQTSYIVVLDEEKYTVYAQVSIEGSITILKKKKK